MKQRGFSLLIGLLPAAAFGHSYGPAPKLVGAPGDDVRVCTACHIGNALNSGTGSVRVILPGGQTYVPGVKQRVVVQVSDAAQRRWGFELSARLNSDLNLAAGELIPVDHQTQVICEDNAQRPCSGGNTFITHTTAGSRNGVTGSAAFSFDWTPPASAAAGPVTFFVAGNAANGNGQPTGDFVYTSSVSLSPVTATAPVVTSAVSAATLAAGGLAPNSWVSIFGTNLSATTRSWREGDFLNGGLPLSLDGVSVILTQGGQIRTMNVAYVSPTQINFLLPSDVSPFPAAATVQVKNPAGTSGTAAVTIQNAAAQLLTVDRRNVWATHANGNLVGNPGLLAGFTSAPAAKGETISIFGTGLGATTPAQIAGQLPVDASALAALPTVTIGGTAGTVVSGAVVAGSPGIYRLTVTVPASVASGDLPVVVQVGTTNSASVLLAVQ